MQAQNCHPREPDEVDFTEIHRERKRIESISRRTACRDQEKHLAVKIED
jgi:hypothetical protein